MYLRQFNRYYMCSLFHVDSGVGTPFQMRLERKNTGVCQRKTFGWVALYSEEKELVLQINKKSWTLGQRSVKIVYRHDWARKISFFSIADSLHQFSLQYPSWWINEQVNPADYADDDKDIFAYIVLLHETSSIRRNLNKLWKSRRQMQIFLCPQCFTGVSRYMVHCPQCAKDMRKDPVVELTSEQVQRLVFKNCPKGQHLIPEHAFSCGYCAPPRWHTPPLTKEELATPQQVRSAILLRSRLLFEFLQHHDNLSLWQATMTNWIPNRQDFQKVFTVDADKAYENYSTRRQAPANIIPLPAKASFRLWVALPEEFANEGNFPLKYRGIIPRLNKNCVWVTWKFSCSDKQLEQQYDGLVWTGERFKFIPQSWLLWS